MEMEGREINFISDHPEKWEEIEEFLSDADFAQKCYFGDEDYATVVGFRLWGNDGQMMDVLKYHTHELAHLPIEKFESDLLEITFRPYGVSREVIQRIYHHLKINNAWPNTADLGVELRSELRDQGGFYKIAEEMGGRWIRIGDIHNRNQDARITLRAVALCKDSKEDLESFVKVIKVFVDTFLENHRDPQYVTMGKIITATQISPEYAIRIALLVKEEFVLNKGSRGEGNTLAFLPADDILEFEHVKTIDEYFKKADMMNHKTSEIVPSVTATKSIDSGEEKMLDIFISHSSSDMEVAEVLIELLRSALNLPAEQIRCTSVDGYRLPIGADTDEELRRELKEAKSFLALVSEESIRSTYVLFEMGARWGAEKHLAPLLTPGTNPSILSGPLRSLNALRCDNASQLHQLVYDLSRILKIPTSSPASYSRFIDRLVSLPPKHQIGSGSGKATTESSTAIEVTGLSEAEMELLGAANKGGRFSILRTEQTGEWVRADGKDFVDDSKPTVAVRYLRALESLERRGHVYKESETNFILTEEGAEAVKDAPHEETRFLMLSLGTVHRQTGTGQDLAELVLENHENRPLKFAFIQMEERGDLADVVHHDTFNQIIAQINREFSDELLMVGADKHKKLYDDINVKYVKYLALKIKFTDEQGVEHEQTVVRA